MALSPDILPGIGEEPWEVLRGRVELDTYGVDPKLDSPYIVPDTPIEKVVFVAPAEPPATPRLLPSHA